MLGLHLNSTETKGRLSSILPQALLTDGAGDAAYATAGLAEFDNWTDFSIAFWLTDNKGEQGDLLQDGNDTIFSLGNPSDTNKGFRIFHLLGYIMLVTGNGSAAETAISQQPQATTTLQHNPVLGVFALCVKSGANTQVFTRSNRTSNDGTIVAHDDTNSWGDVGANVSLTVGGYDSPAATTLALSEDWAGSGISHIAMWKAALSSAEATTLYNNGTPGDYRKLLPAKLPRHYWIPDIGDNVISRMDDKIATAPTALAFVNQTHVARFNGSL
jgi:hypothetical protein